MSDIIYLGNRRYVIWHTHPGLLHQFAPLERIKVIQSVWDSGGFKEDPQIQFVSWTGKGGENGDCDSRAVAIFRVRKWHEVSKTT